MEIDSGPFDYTQGGLFQHSLYETFIPPAKPPLILIDRGP